MNDSIKTSKPPNKKAEHKAKIAALKQKAIDALNEDIKFKADSLAKVAQLERAVDLLTLRVNVLERRPVPVDAKGDKGETGAAGPRGEKGSGFWS